MGEEKGGDQYHAWGLDNLGRAPVYRKESIWQNKEEGLSAKREAENLHTAGKEMEVQSLTRGHTQGVRRKTLSAKIYSAAKNIPPRRLTNHSDEGSHARRGRKTLSDKYIPQRRLTNNSDEGSLAKRETENPRIQIYSTHHKSDTATRINAKHGTTSRNQLEQHIEHISRIYPLLL